MASDRERERALSSLREHFVRGRLTLDELSERTELALRSRSRDELRRSCRGLPQMTAHAVADAVVRGVSLVVLTGAWLLFSLVLVVVFALTALIHGPTLAEFGGFLVVWLVPTYLLSRLWRKRPFRPVG
jgi:Flp pilus assembly protein TadB